MSSRKKEKNTKTKKDDPKVTKYYNATKDKIMNEIQELLTDQEMIKKQLIEQNNDYYILEIIFPKEITLTKNNIKFLLYINKEYPKIEPELYCLTIFSHPHLCDGRNLINNAINGDWSNNQFPLEIIINKIPKFIIKYNELKDNNNIVGKFSLNKYYTINFLRNLPIFFHVISNENKIITISDISLCLYDLDKNLGFCKLSFFLDIKDLIEIKINSNENKISLKYKYSPNNKTKKLNINTSFYETINAILKEKMKLYQKKIGKLPEIDINTVEKEIEEKEKELKENEKNYNLERNLYLMSLYQKAVEYYSAVNNPKFIEITHKIHKILENTKLNNDSFEKKNEIKNDRDLNSDINKKYISQDKSIDNNINSKEKQKDYSNNSGEKMKNQIEIKKKEEIEKDILKKEENKNNEVKKDEAKQQEIKIEINKIQEIKIEENKEEENKKAEFSTDINIKKDEVKKDNAIKDVVKKDEIQKIEIKKADKKKEDDNKDKIKSESDNENKDKIIVDNKIINKDNKGDKNKEEALRLKIDEGQLGTLDVGDDEEEEEEEEEDEK